PSGVDDPHARLPLPAPAQIARTPHCPGRVAGHGMDPAVRCAGPGSDDSRSLGSKSIQPFGSRDRLAGGRVVTEPAPVAFVLYLLVRNRAFDHEYERLEFATVGLAEPFQEVVLASRRPTLEVDQWPMHGDLRQAGKSAERDFLDTRLRRSGQRDRVSVAAEAGVDPQHVDERFFCLKGSGRGHNSHLSPDGCTVTNAAGVGRRPTSAASPVLTFGSEWRQAT